MDAACLDQHCAANPDDPVCLTLWKSDDSSDSDRIIEGLASADIRDTEGEIVHPDQLDFSYLPLKGKVNWIHKGDPGDQIARVLSYKVGLIKDIVPAKHRDKVKGLLNHVGVWIRAKLKHGLKKAEDVWTDMTANPDDHGLGFSLQGTAKRQGTDVVGGMVTNVALTPNPVLAETFAVLSKALGTSYARQDQTGAAAATREDLRDEVISTTLGDSKYGRKMPGGVAFMAETVVGHKTTRGSDNRPVREPVSRSFAMPAGEPVQQPFDTLAAVRALKSFLRHVRASGANRGNVLDGSENYFQVMHGLDRETAKLLAKYVRQNADKLFKKCFPSLGCCEETEENTMPELNPFDQLEKAIETPTLDEGDEPTPEPVEAELETPATEPVTTEPLAKAKHDADDAPGGCINCGYSHLSKGSTTCPQCGAAMQKSVPTPETDTDSDPDAQFVDVTPLLKTIDLGLKASGRADTILAKSLLHVVNANATLGKVVKSLREESANLRKELADRSDTLTKSIDAICERLGVLVATPRPTKSAQTIEKSKTDGSDPAKDTPEVDLEFQNFLMKGHVSAVDVGMVRMGQLTKSVVLENIKKKLRLEQVPANGNGGGGFERW